MDRIFSFVGQCFVFLVIGRIAYKYWERFQQNTEQGNIKSSGKDDNSSSQLDANDSIKMIQQIMDNIVVNTSLSRTTFDDIIGQNAAKDALTEMIIYPSLEPSLFQGLTSPPKALLLFGPPGNGKTLLAKAIAVESNLTFLCVTASTLTSKWVGEGEKLVKTLFLVAKNLQPSIIFIDEIDSILRERSDHEHEASRRLKTEFFTELDGIKSNSDDRITIIGATNRPQELDDAILSRFSGKIYVPPPNPEDRFNLLKKLLSGRINPLREDELHEIALTNTDLFSGRDLQKLAREAAMHPVRELMRGLEATEASGLRDVTLYDFELALRKVRPNLTAEALLLFDEWNEKFGS